jgi:hypothetical protein
MTTVTHLPQLTFALIILAIATVRSQAQAQSNVDNGTSAKAGSVLSPDQQAKIISDFHAALDAVRQNPQERIRIVDEWVQAYPAVLNPAPPVRPKPAPGTNNAVAPAPAVPAGSIDPLLADVFATDAEIANAMASANLQKLMPEQRIKWIDGFVAANKAAINQRNKNLRLWQERQRQLAAQPVPKP